MRINFTYFSLLLGFLVISAVICQFGLLLFGIKAYYLQQSVEEEQASNPDIRFRLLSRPDIKSNASTIYSMFLNNVTQPSEYIKPYIQREMSGSYTQVTINRSFTYQYSENNCKTDILGIQGYLIGLDEETLFKIHSSLPSGQEPVFEDEVIIIQDIKNSQYRTEFQIRDKMELFTTYPFNSTAYIRNVSISGILDKDFPQEDEEFIEPINENPLWHDFADIIPVDLFTVTGKGLILITSFEKFCKLYYDLQNPPIIEYSLFKHIWLEKNKIDFNNIKPMFNVINSYVEQASHRSEFFWNKGISSDFSFRFSSDILITLNSAQENVEQFLSIAILFGIPIIIGTYFLVDFLIQVYERKKQKDYKLLELRGFSSLIIFLNKNKIYFLTAVIGGLLGIVLAIVCMFLFFVLSDIFNIGYSYNQFNLESNFLFETITISIFISITLACLKLIIPFIRPQKTPPHYLKREDRIQYDLYFFIIGISAIIGILFYDNILPESYRTTFIFESLYLLNLIGFFGIIFGSLSVINKVVDFISNNLSKMPFKFRNVMVYQTFITFRQRKQYFRLIRVITFFILFSQVLNIFYNTINEREKTKALNMTGAEGYINTASIPSNIKDHFNISVSTPILRIGIDGYRGDYLILGIDIDSFFSVAYFSHSIDKQTIETLKTVENGILYHYSLSERINNSKLTITYWNKTHNMTKIDFYAIKSFSFWPRLMIDQGVYGFTSFLVMKLTDLKKFIADTYASQIAWMEEGSLINFKIKPKETSISERQFQGYNIDYYKDKMNSRLLNFISTEILYLFINGVIFAIISVTIIFYFLVNFREKELALEQTIGLSRRHQFFTIEISSIIILLICLIYGTFTAMVASMNFMILYQLIDRNFSWMVFFPVESLILIIILYLVISLFSLPFKFNIYRGTNLFRNIREM